MQRGNTDHHIKHRQPWGSIPQRYEISYYDHGQSDRPCGADSLDDSAGEQDLDCGRETADYGTEEENGQGEEKDGFSAEGDGYCVEGRLEDGGAQEKRRCEEEGGCCGSVEGGRYCLCILRTTG